MISNIKNKISFGLLLLAFLSFKANAQQTYCVTGCNDNSFLWSDDPNTIEYDNMVSGFHSTILRESDGKVLVWGQGASANGDHLPEPIEVSPENGFNYEGTILKITLGSMISTSSSQQFAILTTEGLYMWGGVGNLVSYLVKEDKNFGKVSNYYSKGNAYGLPGEMTPYEVKMLFGSYKTLGIVTCTGEAWLLSDVGSKNTEGDYENKQEWTQIKTAPNTPLEHVVAMRGASNGMVALTSKGEVYTWGIKTYLGDNTGEQHRGYATKMKLPANVTPKMIGMTFTNVSYGNSQGNSYYLLTTQGDLYALGNNSQRQLGDFTYNERRSWVRVKSDANTNMSNIAWVSPNEHDGTGYAAVNALTQQGKLWSWGANDGEMIGGGTFGNNMNLNKNPMLMGRGLDDSDKLIALETGGHTTMVIRQCSKKYGYIGHKINGSMGDGKTSESFESVFNFSNTAEVNLCAAPTVPVVKDLEICAGETGNLNDAHTIKVPRGMKIEWYTIPEQNPNHLVQNPEVVTEGEYYAFYVPSDGVGCDSPEASEKVIVRLKADLKIQISINNPEPSVGDIVEFTIKVTNSGGSNAEEVLVHANLPSGYQFLSADFGYILGTGKWNVETLNVAQEKQIKIKAKVKDSGSYAFLVSVDSEKEECDLSNNETTISIGSNTTLMITNPMIYQRTNP